MEFERLQRVQARSASRNNSIHSRNNRSRPALIQQIQRPTRPHIFQQAHLLRPTAVTPRYNKHILRKRVIRKHRKERRIHGIACRVVLSDQRLCIVQGVDGALAVILGPFVAGPPHLLVCMAVYVAPELDVGVEAHGVSVLVCLCERRIFRRF